MKLVIAEKPSVAQSLAAVLGAKERGQGYLQGNGYVVSWCVGHLIGLAAADSYDPKYSKWCYEDLPIIPKQWKYAVAPDKKEQYEVLVSLMNRPDVESLVCATDAGREGELIFRLVYDHAGCRKPFERLWISSMEDSAIREGFQSLRPGSEYDRLYEAALCRAKADWLVGITGTRLFSTLYRKTLNVGRVMTPTLALVVDREAAISEFKKEKFYTVVLDCGKFTASSERCENRKAADHLSAACSTQAAVVKQVEKKQKSAQPPKLYDLTSLQRDGNRLYGYTAQQVLLVEYALVRKNRTAGVRGLRAFHQPIQSPFEIELDRSRIRNRVVGTQFLNEFAITWRSAICGNDMIERRSFLSVTCQTNFNSHLLVKNLIVNQLLKAQNPRGLCSGAKIARIFHAAKFPPTKNAADRSPLNDTSASVFRAAVPTAARTPTISADGRTPLAPACRRPTPCTGSRRRFSTRPCPPSAPTAGRPATPRRASSPRREPSAATGRAGSGRR